MRRSLTFLACFAAYAASCLNAQAVPRADTPRGGSLRITFAPIIEMWDERFLAGRRESLGLPLTGDSVGGTYLPVVARLQADTRTAGLVPGFVASLGRGLLALRAERRTTPFELEWGVTDRLALGVMLPLVRVFTRAHLTLNPETATLGLNPLISDPITAAAEYGAFFTEFAGALTELEQNIAGGAYGCPSSPQCATATGFLTEARGVRDALRRSAYGPGAAGGAPFLPLADSDGGLGIDANVARLQQELASSYGVSGFSRSFLLPSGPVDDLRFDMALADEAYGFGTAPLRNTPRYLRFWPGDAEIAARYRFAAGPVYAATVGALVRLPTGHLDSPTDPFDIAAGDGQTDVEGQLVQELTVAGRLWLNLSIRVGIQRPAERERRIAGPLDFLVPSGAAALTRWDPGDYLALDVAPMFRLSKQFAAGVTLGYVRRARDRTTYANASDSVEVATRLGVDVPASVLDAGTDVRRFRLGGALTYAGPRVEGSVSVERTISAEGGPLPAATVFRVVLRAALTPF